MAQNQLRMPLSHGGLMRYDEEYESRFKLTPIQVIIFLILIVVFVVAMKIFWPISG